MYFKNLKHHFSKKKKSWFIAGGCSELPDRIK